MKLKIQELSHQYINEIISIRRYIHSNPELSFEESETSAFICQKLDEEGISYNKGYATHGILAVLKGEKGEGKTIALRADMDALPIREQTNVPFKSNKKGVMHACGHDIHTACLLGAVKILNRIKSQLRGTVLFVFQPGEEKLPGGASLMLADGLFNEYIPDLIIGQHVYPELPAGEVGFKQGQYMAAADEIYITFHGQGGHAALPYSTIDTVLMASQAVVSLQQVVSRNIPANVPAVLSFGNIVCNSVMNIIPETVKIEGTFRSMDEEWRYNAHDKIRKVANSVASGMGGKADVDIQIGFPSVINNPEVTINAQNAAKELLGDNKVHDLEIRMTAEDFGWYAQKYPACFYRLGVGYADGANSDGLHSPKFLPNEQAIETGISVMAYIAFNALS